MSLLFADNSTDTVDVGSGTSIDNLSVGTMVWWGYWPSVANVVRSQWGKIGTQGLLCFRRGADGTTLRFQYGRTTTTFQHDSNTGMLIANTWLCVAMTWNVPGAAAAWYRGSLTSAMADYGSGSPASSGTHDDSGGALTFGFYTGGASDNVRYATIGFYNRVLTLGELRSWQYRPRKLSGCVGFWDFGRNGTGTQPDLSGNFNAGTVSGATIAPHVPLPSIYGGRTPRSYIVTPPASGDYPGKILRRRYLYSSWGR